ncbi:MAG: tripartite tricarboxylate transporter permease [Aminobacterium sp.]|uniref:tripartite tricarboxylate transporter permease n=1 Tax=Aminobacterium sp. TaxID=1872491 RepID=UPI001BCFFEE5|nr:tripartite tricarboxylate transporter permease [Aminobacterium sp.]MEA4877893.1 tripartite tricarboxylate transporter permease [Aminobacterium sp.]
MSSTILSALMLALAPINLLFALIGTVLGIIIGALPGLTSTMGVALFIPVTFTMSPETGLIFLASIYCASTYGGSISAILIQTPGTPSAIITAIDGYELTKQGHGGKALAMATFASFIGGLVSATALLLIAPPLSKLVLRFGPSEIFFLAIFGLTIIVGLSKGSMVKGLISGALGVLLATTGVDALTGTYRYTFNNMALFEGIPIVPAVIGLFSASQVFVLAEQKRTTIQYKDATPTTESTWLRLSEVKHLWGNLLRSSVIGTIVGIIPGAGMSIASAMAYNEAKRFSKNADQFGKGSLEGVAASESANNGVTGGSLVPLLTLGIPGNAVSAVFLGGLLIHGLKPGMTLFTKHADIAYALLFGIFIANIMMFVVGSLAAKRFAKVAVCPTNILAPIIMSLCIIGSYAIRNNVWDVIFMLGFGFMGYYMKKTGYSLASLILGLILGPMIESELRRALMLSGGAFLPLLSRPLSLFLFLLVIFSLVGPYLKRKRTA